MSKESLFTLITLNCLVLSINMYIISVGEITDIVLTFSCLKL